MSCAGTGRSILQTQRLLVAATRGTGGPPRPAASTPNLGRASERKTARGCRGSSAGERMRMARRTRQLTVAAFPARWPPSGRRACRPATAVSDLLPLRPLRRPLGGRALAGRRCTSLAHTLRCVVLKAPGGPAGRLVYVEACWYTSRPWPHKDCLCSAVSQEADAAALCGCPAGTACWATWPPSPAATCRPRPRTSERLQGGHAAAVGPQDRPAAAQPGAA